MTNPNVIANEIVHSISGTMTKGKATEQECDQYLNQFFLRHSNRFLFEAFFKPLTYDLAVVVDSVGRHSQCSISPTPSGIHLKTTWIVAVYPLPSQAHKVHKQ